MIKFLRGFIIAMLPIWCFAGLIAYMVLAAWLVSVCWWALGIQLLVSLMFVYYMGEYRESR